MPVSSLTVALRDAVRESFEMLAFADVNGWEECAAEPKIGDCIGSRIQIKKPVSGSLRLFLERNHCADLVGAVNGGIFFEDGIEDELLRDFMSELVNTIAGRFTASVAGETKVSSIGLPSAIRDEGRVFDEDVGHMLVAFTVDDRPAFLSVDWS